MGLYDVTSEQLEHITIDTGVVFLNYGEAGHRKLAPCEGENTFVVEQEFREIEYNGRRGKTKGLRRIINEDATLTVNLLNLSQENLKLALAGAKVESDVITNGDGTIPAADYINSVTLVGETLDGEFKVITIYRALGDNGLNLSFGEDGEATLQVEFSANYDPTDLDDPIYKIEDASAVLAEPE